MTKPLFKLPVAQSQKNIGSEASGSYVAKYLNAHYQKVKHLEKDVYRLPLPGEIMFLQSDNQFNAFTFIPWISKSRTIEHLYVTTYSINKRVIGALTQMHASGEISAITIVVSDTMIHRNPLVSNMLAALAKKQANITVLFSWVHAKVSLLKTTDDYYVIEGSGNWGENAKYEQYILVNDKKAFEFRMKLITDVEIRYKAQNGVNIKMT